MSSENMIFGYARVSTLDQNVPGSFKSTRHFVATVALASTGGNEHSVAKVLGHARTSTTTDVYGHLLPEDRERITEDLEPHLAG